MEWLLNLAQEKRKILQSGRFYQTLAAASCPADIKGWVRQLYYQSRGFTATLALRSSAWRESCFNDCFTQHAVEELDHSEQLIDWMRQHKFLEPDEHPTSVPPTLDTLLATTYFLRCVIRKPIKHQVLVLNFVSEGVALDFYSKVNPKLKELGLHTGEYWQLHDEIDCEHLTMGLDLIPQYEQDSPEGKMYLRLVEEIFGLYARMLDSWSDVSVNQQLNQNISLSKVGVSSVNYKLATSINKKLEKERRLLLNTPVYLETVEAK